MRGWFELRATLPPTTLMLRCEPKGASLEASEAGHPVFQLHSGTGLPRTGRATGTASMQNISL